MKATVLFSGGVDSTACIHLLARDGYEVRGIFVDFGQAARVQERAAVQRLSKLLKIPLDIINVLAPEKFGVGELLGRNAFLIFAAILLGRCERGILTLGIHSGTTYFDCSPGFVDRITPLVEECTGGQLTFVAPFLHWSKDDVYSYYASTGIALEETYSCEAGGQIACGMCPSCRDRERFECWQSAAT